jgi:hypothetical protein
MATSTTAYGQMGHFALGIAGILLVDQRGVLSNGNVVNDDRGAHVYRILERVRKHGGGGLQRNEDGNCRLRKIEVQKSENSQSIEMLTTHMNTIFRTNARVKNRRQYVTRTRVGRFNHKLHEDEPCITHRKQSPNFYPLNLIS